MENSTFNRPNNRFSSRIGLAINNSFEAKVRPKDSTQTESEKVNLLSNLNISTGYNIAADSLNIDEVQISGGTQLFKDKMNINFRMSLNPYALDSNNNIINTFNIDNDGSLFRLTNASVNVGYSLSNNSFSSANNDNSEQNDDDDDRAVRSGGRTDDYFGVSQDFSNERLSDDDKENKKDKNKEGSELYKYKIPWNLRLDYVVNYSNTRRENSIAGHSLRFSGDIDISPKWSIGVSSGYDFVGKGFSTTQLRFERDLLSWRMNFSWVPFGTRSQWNFFVGIKSSILKDLKYDQRKRADRVLGN